MTANQLRDKLNKELWGMKPRPSTYKVDAETYASICQDVFDNKIGTDVVSVLKDGTQIIRVFVGPNNGILFKGFELILNMDNK